MALFGWIEMLLKNSKAVVSILAIIISGFGYGSWTIYDQHEELTELRPKEVEVVVEETTLKPYDHTQIKQRILKLEKIVE